jgi:hypothetical protein
MDFSLVYYVKELYTFSSTTNCSITQTIPFWGKMNEKKVEKQTLDRSLSLMSHFSSEEIFFAVDIFIPITVFWH